MSPVTAPSSGDDATAAWAASVYAALGNSNPAQGPAFVVRYNSTSSEYEARNGVDGTIDYSGSAAHTVTNNAIDACPNYGYVQLKGSTMTITGSIEVDQFKSLMFDRILISGVAVNGITLTGTSVLAYSNVYGHTLNFPANYTGTCVLLEDVQGCKVSIANLFPASGVGGAGSIGYRIYGNAGGCYYNHISNSYLTALATMIQVESAAAAGWANVNHFTNIDAWMNGNALMDYGVRIIDSGVGTTNNYFTNVHFDDLASGSVGFTNDGWNIFTNCGVSDVTAGGTSFVNPAGSRAHLVNCQLPGDATYVGINNAGIMTMTGGNLYDSAGITNSGTLKLDNVLFSSTSTHTLSRTITFPFVEGHAPTNTGFDIDAAAEYAYAYFSVPPDVFAPTEMRIYAMSVDAEADAMHLEIRIQAGGDNEAVTTHAVQLTDQNSTSTNFDANDIIYWTVTDAVLLALRSGDSGHVHVLHEVAGGADCETDAHFRSIEIDYT